MNYLTLIFQFLSIYLYEVYYLTYCLKGTANYFNQQELCLKLRSLNNQIINLEQIDFNKAPFHFLSEL